MPPPNGGGVFRKGESMGIEDRDWYREAYRDKEKKYGSDFSSGPSYKTIQIKQKKSSGLKTGDIGDGSHCHVTIVSW